MECKHLKVKNRLFARVQCNKFMFYRVPVLSRHLQKACFKLEALPKQNVSKINNFIQKHPFFVTGQRDFEKNDQNISAANLLMYRSHCCVVVLLCLNSVVNMSVIVIINCFGFKCDLNLSKTKNVSIVWFNAV